MFCCFILLTSIFYANRSRKASEFVSTKILYCKKGFSHDFIQKIIQRVLIQEQIQSGSVKIIKDSRNLRKVFAKFKKIEILLFF